MSGDGKVWNVQLDIRDLGGHLDFTKRAGLVLFPIGCGMRRLVWLLLVPCLFFLLVFMLLRLRMFPPPLVESSWNFSVFLGGLA